MFTQGTKRLAFLAIVASSCSPLLHAQPVDALAPGGRKYLRASTPKKLLDSVKGRYGEY